MSATGVRSRRRLIAWGGGIAITLAALGGAIVAGAAFDPADRDRPRLLNTWRLVETEGSGCYVAARIETDAEFRLCPTEPTTCATRTRPESWRTVDWTPDFSAGPDGSNPEWQTNHTAVACTLAMVWLRSQFGDVL